MLLAKQHPEPYTFQEFCEIIARLRAPEGCPWDREQTHATLKSCMIEEAYEVVDGIRSLDETGKADNLCEELGDVLMQVVLHSRIGEEEGLFCLEDVVDGISRKMIFRHPHVFGSTEADTSEKVLQNWEELKKQEKGNRSPEEEIASIPKCLPALIRTAKVQKKLDRYYQAFRSEDDSFQRAAEGLEQLKTEQDPAREKELAGQLLWQVCNVLRLKKINGEEALTEALENMLKNYEIPD